MEENSHTIPLFIFFQGTADRACLGEVNTSGSLSSEGVGYGGGLVPDGLVGSGALKDPKAGLRRDVVLTDLQGGGFGEGVAECRFPHLPGGGQTMARWLVG